MVCFCVWIVGVYERIFEWSGKLSVIWIFLRVVVYGFKYRWRKGSRIIMIGFFVKWESCYDGKDRFYWFRKWWFGRVDSSEKF